VSHAAAIRHARRHDRPRLSVQAADRPFHNIALYWNSPLKLMRGELIDTAIADADWGKGDNEEAAHST